VIADQHWYLFGYDMRQLGRHWVAAWRDLFFGPDSPLRRHLDEVVLLQRDGRAEPYQAGEPIGSGAGAHAACNAICLPDEFVLHRRMTFPAAVESDLHTALLIEVAANSPFAADDTAWGWRLADRGEHELTIDLAIAARSAVMGFLGRTGRQRDADALEVWAAVPGGMVVLAGFGEGHREALYRRRLRRVGLMSAGLLLLLLVLAAAYALGKQLELARVEALAAATERSAGDVRELREAIAEANRQILAARDIMRQYPSPHRELARLSGLLGDEAWVAHFSSNGDTIRIRGRAADAASVMQALSADPAYAEVTAPQAISRVGNSDEEQFYLDLRIAAENTP
jgi:hypothetical protein